MASYPLYVESTDGKFYRNPKFVREGWFINMEGNRTPELVLIQPVLKTASQILDTLRIKYRNLQKSKTCRKRIDGKLTPVVIYLFELVAPIPTPHTHIGVLEKVQSGYTYYDFK